MGGKLTPVFCSEVGRKQAVGASEGADDQSCSHVVGEDAVESLVCVANGGRRIALIVELAEPLLGVGGVDGAERHVGDCGEHQALVATSTCRFSPDWSGTTWYQSPPPQRRTGNPCSARRVCAIPLASSDAGSTHLMTGISITTDVIVIGARMAGLTAAEELAKAGVSTVVLDKGRAPGGRMATRTIGGARFDHGAQLLSARSELFRERIGQLRHAGRVTERDEAKSWTTPDRGIEPHLVGSGGMRRIPEHLAVGLDVRNSIMVDRLEATRTAITALAGDQAVAHASAVILTPPIPQLLNLWRSSGLQPGSETMGHLETVSYKPNLTVMASLDAEVVYRKVISPKHRLLRGLRTISTRERRNCLRPRSIPLLNSPDTTLRRIPRYGPSSSSPRPRPTCTDESSPRSLIAGDMPSRRPPSTPAQS